MCANYFHHFANPQRDNNINKNTLKTACFIELFKVCNAMTIMKSFNLCSIPDTHTHTLHIYLTSISDLRNILLGR